MDYVFKQESICGKEHLKKKIGNQDAVIYKQKDRIGVIVLSDGAGSRNHAEEGARITVEVVLEYLLDHEHTIFDMKYQSIQNEIISVILDALQKITNDKCCNIRDYGATILFCFTDGQRYITGHLGDGSILSIKDGKYTVISFPENFENTNATILTTSINASNHLRILKKNIKDSDGIILLSDGMEECFFEKNYQKRNDDQIKMLIKTSDFADDASYVMMKWSDIL